MPVSAAPLLHDTDRDWRVLGERQPFYGVLADECFLRENLSEERLRQFYASGVAQIAGLVETIHRHVAPDFAPAHAIDFGCGVGRLAFAMAEWAGHVTGVDVAPAMLAEARAQQAEYGRPNVAFQHELPPGPVDWVNSYIVFQHIPAARGLVLLDRLLACPGPGGVASVHVTAFRDPAPTPAAPPPRRRRKRWRLRLKPRQWRRAFGKPKPAAEVDLGWLAYIRMHDYDFSRVLQAFVAHGFEGLWLEHVDHGGCHGFNVIGRRGT